MQVVIFEDVVVSKSKKHEDLYFFGVCGGLAIYSVISKVQNLPCGIPLKSITCEFQYRQHVDNNYVRTGIYPTAIVKVER